MKRYTATIIAAAVATTMGGAALADEGFITGHHDMADDGNNVHMDDTMRGHFEHADKDNDGKVTKAEVEAHVNAAEEFKSMFEERSGRRDP